MKITLGKEEILTLLRLNFPPAMIPSDYEVTHIKAEGYGSEGEWSITLEKKES
jgi:hypothetical protein